MNNHWLIESVLDKICDEMRRLYWNKHQKDWNTPFLNTGEEYSNDVFTVRSYSWDEADAIIPNFKYGDFECYWYKHSHRGLVWYYHHQQGAMPSSEYLEHMLEECIAALQQDFGVK